MIGIMAALVVVALAWLLVLRPVWAARADVESRLNAAVTDLAHAFGLRVVAEGIEDEAVLDAVRAMGCEHGQGFHLARPVPSEQLDAVLAAPPGAGQG